MNTKLTLNVNKTIIEQAKDYAKSNQISLSRLIENYLHSLTSKNTFNNTAAVSPLVESLTGILPSINEQDAKDEYYEYLNKKYS